MRVSDGIGRATPGRLTPLCEVTVPPTIDVASGASLLDGPHGQPDVPVVDQHVLSGSEHGAEHRRADRKVAVARRVLTGDDDLLAAHELDGLGQLADAELRPLQVGDQGDRAAGRLPRLRGRAARAARGPPACRGTCSGGRRPCRRRAAAPIASGVQHAGPMVATIFVRRWCADIAPRLPRDGESPRYAVIEGAENNRAVRRAF